MQFIATDIACEMEDILEMVNRLGLSTYCVINRELFAAFKGQGFIVYVGFFVEDGRALWNTQVLKEIEYVYGQGTKTDLITTFEHDIGDAESLVNDLQAAILTEEKE